jgi:hypothetical protein
MWKNSPKADAAPRPVMEKPRHQRGVGSSTLPKQAIENDYHPVHTASGRIMWDIHFIVTVPNMDNWSRP